MPEKDIISCTHCAFTRYYCIQYKLIVTFGLVVEILYGVNIKKKPLHHFQIVHMHSTIHFPCKKNFFNFNFRSLPVFLMQG